MEDEMIPHKKKETEWEIAQQKMSRKTKNRMDGSCPQRYIKNPTNTRMDGDWLDTVEKGGAC